MDKYRTLISTYTSINDKFRRDQMKLCFLWYDEILFEDIGTYDQSRWFSNLLLGEDLPKKLLGDLTDLIVPLRSRTSVDMKEYYEKQWSRGYPRWGDDWEQYTYPEPENAEQYAHNVLLKKIEAEWGLDGLSDEHAEGRARVATDAVNLWQVINTDLPCMFQANDDEKLAMSAAASFYSGNQSSAPDAFELFTLSVPEMTTVPWYEVIRLKRAGKFDQLRNRLKEISQSSSNDLNAARSELIKHEQIATEEILEKYRPNVKKVVAESLWANIPNIPFLNPVGAYFGARDIKLERDKASSLGWFYLLRDIRKLPECSGSDEA